MRITVELDDDEARALLKAGGRVADLLGIGAYGAMQIGGYVEACAHAEQQAARAPSDLARWVDGSFRAMIVRVERIQTAPPRPRLVLEGSVMSFSFLA